MWKKNNNFFMKVNKNNNKRKNTKGFINKNTRRAF